VGGPVPSKVGQAEEEGHLQPRQQGELEGDVQEQLSQGDHQSQAAGSHPQPDRVPVLRRKDSLDREPTAQRAVPSVDRVRLVRRALGMEHGDRSVPPAPLRFSSTHVSTVSLL
jgi:hypothetical protein